jgi:hypothetical protein
MDPRRPLSLDKERPEELNFKITGRKRRGPTWFVTQKREDSIESSEKRNKRNKGAKKKKKRIPKKVLFQYRKIEIDKKDDRPQTPKKEEKDEFEDRLKIPPASNWEGSSKIFEIKKVQNMEMSDDGKRNLNRIVEIKPDPLKEISKIIFKGVRRKKILQIPEEPLRIYVENMGHFDEEKANQTRNAINYHKPAVAVVLETSAFFHKGFVTFKHQDSKQSMIIMIRRDLLHEIQIFQYNGFPIIKTFDTMFCVVHSVASTKQHIKLPDVSGRIVYLGDFNIGSTCNNPNSNVKEKLELAENFNFEATWEVGYISIGVKGGSIFIDQSNRDHQAMIYSADFPEPEKKLIPQAGKIRWVTKNIIKLAVEDPKTCQPFTKAINRVKGLQVRAKAVYSRDLPTDILKPAPKVWERLKSTCTPFVNASEVKLEVLDSLKDYFQRFPPYEEKIEFSQEDYNVGFYLFSYFLQRPKEQLLHSNARDRNGVSYGDILEATLQIVQEIKQLPPEQQGEKVENLFKYFWKQFTETKFTYTKCFLNRKKTIITEHKHLRMLSIQDSMWKFLEVVFQPVTWICNRIAIKNVPGTFGFVAGGATFNAFMASCPQIEDKEIAEQNLRPEEVSEDELDEYEKLLDQELEKKESLGEDYDPTEFFFRNVKC